ncbi:GumC family protein [Arenibaculum pallidiluteum]|uniref:GumC family protein n=1 Tax=Arenibaculum pallidiluteum TaxID=2812559 RepID=UPI001A965528|nr:polysaccharide biosynthesis tyrosine autokinase [Arenibaculum pallidiluteum]
MIASRHPADEVRSGPVDWFRLLARRKLIVLGSVLIAVACASLVVLTTPTRYRAEAVLALNVRNIQISPTANIISTLPQEEPVIRTEIDLISSRLMAERVADRLKLDEAVASELWPERPWWSSPEGLLGAAFRWGWAPAGSDGAAADARREIVDRLMSGLKVSNDGRSYTIYVAFTAYDPDFAAKAANTYAQAYLDQQVEFQTSGIQSASEWLGSKLETMRIELERSELAVETFRHEAGLSEVAETTPMMLRINALNSEIVLARSARAAAEARLQTALELARSDGTIDGFAEVLASPAIQSLRRDEMETTRSLLQLEQLDAMKGPQAAALAAQKAGIQRQILTEIQRVLSSLASEVEVAKRKELELMEALGEMEATVAQSRRAAIHLNQLQRDANANSTLYESFLTRYKQTIEQDGLATPEARLISAATPPKRPDSSRLPLLGLALLGGIGGGIYGATVRDRLDRRVLQGGVLEARTGTRVVAVVPRVGRSDSGGLAGQPSVAPGSPCSVAVRRVAAVLDRLLDTQEPAVLMIASANPGEGRTSFCTALARSAALLGRQVVVVDADLKRPGIGAAFGIGAGPALNDVLAGNAKWPDAVRTDPLSPAHVIAARPHAGDAGPLLASARFGVLVAALREEYDLVIIDTPAILGSPDAGPVGGVANAALLVVRWGVTAIDDVALALHHLGLGETAVAGIVLNAARRSPQEVLDAVDHAPAVRSRGGSLHARWAAQIRLHADRSRGAAPAAQRPAQGAAATNGVLTSGANGEKYHDDHPDPVS